MFELQLDAVLFNKVVVEAFQTCIPNNIAMTDPFLRRKAGECDYRLMLTALGVAEGATSCWRSMPLLI